MLSNVDLMRLADKFRVNLNAVISKDELPEQHKDGWYILNLQNWKDGSGTHWVACKKGGEETVYFDSYGVLPPVSVIDIDDDKLVVNDKQIQALHGDDNCGLYCIGVMVMFKICRGTNKVRLENFQKLFSADTRKNQYLLKEFLHCYYINEC